MARNAYAVVVAPNASGRIPLQLVFKPVLKTGSAAWIPAGVAHHACYGYAVTREHLEDCATTTGIELVVIDADTRLAEFKQTLRNNEVYFHLAQGLSA